MSELEELAEFNQKAGTSAQGGRAGSVKSRPIAADPSTNEGESKPKDARMWAKQGPNYFPCDEAVKKLQPGQYTVHVSQQSGYFFTKVETQFDDLIHLPDSASDAILQEIKNFWTKEEHFRRFGFLWKRGFLLWGPPGSGKTCTLQQVSEHIVNNGGIAVYVDNPQVTANGLAIFRRIEPKTPIVVMMEDLDAMISQHGEHEVLALLDGELQIDCVVFIATTNYPERLDKRIINRPSRFDLVKLIGMPNPEARKVFLSTKNPRLVENPEELEQWVKDTDKFSIAHLKELIVSVEVFNVPFDFAIKRLAAMMNRAPKSTDARDDLGTGQYT